MKNNPIGKNVFYNLIKTLANIIFPLITFPYISRVLQPSGIGKYNWANSYVGYFSLIASLGISTYAIRECSKLRNDKVQLTKVASQIFSINVLSMIVAYIGLFISLILFPFLNKYRLLILILSLTIFFNIIGTDWINSVFEDFKFITIRSIFFQILALSLMFIFVKKPKDYIVYAIISVLSASGANITNILYRRKFCRIRLTFSLNLKKHIIPIFTLFVLVLVLNIYNNSDITMLGIFKDNKEVGYYSVAVKASSVITQVVASIAYVVMPQLSMAYKNYDYTKINPLLNRSLQFLVGLGFPVCFGTIALSRDIVTLLGGKSYYPAGTALVFLMIGFLFSTLGGSFIGNLILLPSSREKYFTFAFIISASINIILNFFLIPKGGAIAAAFTTMIAELILFLLLIPFVEKKIKLLPMRIFFLPPLIGSIVLLCWCLFIKTIIRVQFLQIAVSIIGSIIIYAIILWKTKYPLFIELVDQYIKRK